VLRSKKPAMGPHRSQKSKRQQNKLYDSTNYLLRGLMEKQPGNIRPVDGTLQKVGTSKQKRWKQDRGQKQ